MGEKSLKHISFEDTNSPDVSSDDESNEVEVVFDPGNPYRRKSSMVASETKKPLVMRSNRRTDCLVHQFLESQRRAKDAASSTSEHDSEHSVSHAADSSPTSTSLQGETYEADRDPNLDSVMDPKAKKDCRAVLDMGSIEHPSGGQVDQQAWTQQMTKNFSDLDLMSYEDDVHSRLLTKQQLSDMAWGVRELSRRLSSMRIRFRVRSIFILTKIYDQDLIPKTRELVLWLLHHDREVRYTVYVQDKLKSNKKFDVGGLIDEVSKEYIKSEGVEANAAKEALSKRLRCWDEEMCRLRPHTFDFVVSLGGDGTVLYASWLFQRIVPPVLSFALGSLGFLTKFDFEDYQKTLTTAFTKGVTVSLRLRFEGTVMRSQARKGLEAEHVSSEDEDEKLQLNRDLVEELVGEERDDEHTHRPDGTFEILNEVVVDRGPNPSKTARFVSGERPRRTDFSRSNVVCRNLWRRRTLFVSPCRWHLCFHADRLNRL